ncbi:unnamed protein product, partial [Toxocara canis]|uniref:BRCA2 n=1 Tax=Toxocara canis TaxID=6265 RepID=A0A183UM00_TOXCA
TLGTPVAQSLIDPIPIVNSTSKNVPGTAVTSAQSQKVVPAAPPVVTTTQMAVPNTPRKAVTATPRTTTPAISPQAAITQGLSSTRSTTEQRQTPPPRFLPGFNLSNISAVAPPTMAATQLSLLEKEPVIDAATKLTPTTRNVTQAAAASPKVNNDLVHICTTQRSDLIP